MEPSPIFRTPSPPKRKRKIRFISLKKSNFKYIPLEDLFIDIYHKKIGFYSCTILFPFPSVISVRQFSFFFPIQVIKFQFYPWPSYQCPHARKEARRSAFPLLASRRVTLGPFLDSIGGAFPSGRSP